MDYNEAKELFAEGEARMKNLIAVSYTHLKAYRFRPENEMAYERQNTSGHNGPRFRQASCRLKTVSYTHLLENSLSNNDNASMAFV